MHTEDVMDTDQKHGAQKRAVHGAHGIVLVQEPVSARTIVRTDQPLPRSSPTNHLILHSQDHVSSKHIRRLTISSVELQASKEDKARPRHVCQQEGPHLELITRLPDQPSIYLKDHQALFRVHDLPSRAAKAEGLPIRITDTGKGRGETIDQMPKAVNLSR